MNIIFVDIDGVLNSYSSLIGIGMSFPYHGPEKANLDPVAVGLLREICKECDASIYIHSTWVLEATGRGTEWFKKLFAIHGFENAKVLDMVHDRGARRSDRIWQAIQVYKPDKYIILDDDRDLEHAYSDTYFVYTDPTNGLRFSHYEKILNMFGKKVPLIFM